MVYLCHRLRYAFTQCPLQLFEGRVLKKELRDQIILGHLDRLCYHSLNLLPALPALTALCDIRHLLAQLLLIRDVKIFILKELFPYEGALYVLLYFYVLS